MSSFNFSFNLIDRHIAITDGVFAIAMTILVLEIAVPTIADLSSGVALNEYFINYLIPSIVIYFISFYIVFNFWENTVILFNFKKISSNLLTLNMATLAAVCLIPFATGFLFKFYNYLYVNIFFSLLILFISLLYLLMFLLLIRSNFEDYFDKKSKIKAIIRDKINNYNEEGIELTNLKLYFRGITLTLLYLLLAPVFSSLISLVLAFVSPFLSVLSFLLILVLRFVIRMRRGSKDDINNLEFTDDEREFVENIRKSIYGE